MLFKRARVVVRQPVLKALFLSRGGRGDGGLVRLDLLDFGRFGAER